MSEAKATKAPNYTPEQEAFLRESYAKGAGMTPEQIAEKIGKTAKSVVAKLSRMGEYIKPTYKTKTGAAPVKKDAHADAIGLIIPELTEAEIESLTKANKSALAKIFKTLAMSKPIDGDDKPSTGSTGSTGE